MAGCACLYLLTFSAYLTMTLSIEKEASESPAASPGVKSQAFPFTTTEWHTTGCCDFNTSSSVLAANTTKLNSTQHGPGTVKNRIHVYPGFEDEAAPDPHFLTECLTNGGIHHISAMAGYIGFGLRDNATEAENSERIEFHGSDQSRPAGRDESINGQPPQETCLLKLSVPEDFRLKLTLEFCSNLNLRAYERLNKNAEAASFSDNNQSKQTVYNATEQPDFKTEQRTIDDRIEYRSEDLNKENYALHESVRVTEHPAKESSTGTWTRDLRAESTVLLPIGCDTWLPLSHVFSQHSRMELTLTTTTLNGTTLRKPALHLRFTAVEKSVADRLHLELVYESPAQGYIQIPKWDGSTQQYSPLIRSCVTVTTPALHLTFLSFVTMAIFGKNCKDDNVTTESEFLSLYTGTCSRGSKRLWKHCTMHRPGPYLYPESLSPAHFSLYFVSNDVNEAGSFGFRAQFSFHNLSAKPELSENGLQWNCSVKHWSDFKQHFPCDLVPQCMGGEDEARCPYTGTLCGPGKFEVGGRCYMYFATHETHSWIKSQKQCAKQGADLVSLESVQEYNDVIDILLRHGNFFLLHVGLRTTQSYMQITYRSTWQWQSGVMAYHLSIGGFGFLPLCASLVSRQFQYENSHRIEGGKFAFRVTKCSVRKNAAFVCELPPPFPVIKYDFVPLEIIPASSPLLATENDHVKYFELFISNALIPLITCPGGHMTHTFLACDVDSACWSSPASAVKKECTAPMMPRPPNFECANGLESVPYTLVCDYRTDCRDSSDENFCEFPPCGGMTPLPCGNSGQCHAPTEICDGIVDCTVGTDEACCNNNRLQLSKINNPPPPGIVQFVLTTVRVVPLSSSQCPPAHFRCANNGYCLPVHFRCNGVKDCPGSEDEAGCNNFECPGFYKCRNSKKCIKLEALCDYQKTCPQHDDELFCHNNCPHTCTCYGLAFYCTSKFSAQDFSSLRYLEARGSGLTPDEVDDNTHLIHLGLGNCQLHNLSDFRLFRLHSLDLSDNRLRVVTLHHFQALKYLVKLILAGNPLVSFFAGDASSLFSLSVSLRVLDLSGTLMTSMTESGLRFLNNINVLNVSRSGINTLLGLETFSKLSVMDVRGCFIAEFPPNVLRGMYQLSWVYGDNPKLCCSATLPIGFNLNRCFAPVDEISYCDALLRSNAYRVALTLFSVLSLLGNLVSFTYRLRLPASVKKLGFNVFVTQLCLSDFLMGVYLAIIGVADRVYLGNYLWKDAVWKSSAACQTAGFLSLLSNETSAFIVFLITVERFIVIRFPFSRLHFVGRSAFVASGIAWFIGLLLASLPLLPFTRRWEFYSQTGICIPLPITRMDFAGHAYSFGVMIVCNLVLFLLIMAGQGLIYLSVQANTMTTVTDTGSRAKDSVIARRLLTIVMSDFMCWFPIGLCGVLSSYGYPIPGEVNVAMAIFVLPLNSALNPFLYTLNIIMENRQKRLEGRIKKFLLSEIRTGRLTNVY